jgi:hypothetical protein
MKSDMQKELREFYRGIAKALPRDGRKTLLPDIKAGVESYLSENPDATIDDVIGYVGTPEDISNEYYANQDGKAITRKINVSRIILISVISVVGAALLLYLGFMLYALVHDRMTYPAYSVTEPPVVVTRSDAL